MIKSTMLCFWVGFPRNFLRLTIIERAQRIGFAQRELSDLNSRRFALQSILRKYLLIHGMVKTVHFPLQTYIYFARPGCYTRQFRQRGICIWFVGRVLKRNSWKFYDIWNWTIPVGMKFAVEMWPISFFFRSFAVRPSSYRGGNPYRS